MSIAPSQAFPPRALRRNRMVLCAAIVVGTPLIALLVGFFTANTKPGLLLLAIDEMPVQRSVMAKSVLVEEVHAPVSEPAPAVSMPIDTTAIDIETSQVSAEVSDVRWFNGRPVRPVRTLVMTTTAYSPDERSCGESADGVTASGYSVWTNGMKLAAADTSLLPFGTMISIPGYDEGNVIPVLDRGGAIKGQRLDLLHPTHEQALQWGVQQLEVTVWEYADGLPNDFVARYNRASSVNP